MAIRPPAPGRFSITRGWPSSLSTPGWTMRAIASVLPPGGKLTRRRIGRSGKALAGAPDSVAHRHPKNRLATSRFATNSLATNNVPTARILFGIACTLRSHHSAAVDNHSQPDAILLLLRQVALQQQVESVAANRRAIR